MDATTVLEWRETVVVLETRLRFSTTWRSRHRIDLPLKFLREIEGHPRFPAGRYRKENHGERVSARAPTGRERAVGGRKDKAAQNPLASDTALLRRCRSEADEESRAACGRPSCRRKAGSVAIAILISETTSNTCDVQSGKAFQLINTQVAVRVRRYRNRCVNSLSDSGTDCGHRDVVGSLVDVLAILHSGTESDTLDKTVGTGVLCVWCCRWHVISLWRDSHRPLNTAQPRVVRFF